MNAFVTDKLNSHKLRDQEFDSKLLNEALSVLIDSRDFYSQTEKLVQDEILNNLFLQYAKNRENTCAYITNLLVARNTQAVQSGTMSGELRKLYTEFLSLMDDESSGLLERLIDHETRNMELLEDLFNRANTDFVAALLYELSEEVKQSISTMQGHVDNTAEVLDHKDNADK